MKKILAIISIATFIYSCKTGEGLKFSDLIVGKEKSFVPEIQKTESQTKDFIAAENFDSMAFVSEKMERLVDEKLKEVKELNAPDLKFADNFKKDAIDYFTYMRSVYTGYVKYARAETADNRDEELKKIQLIVNKKDLILRTMRDSQKRCAKANGFKIID